MIKETDKKNHTWKDMCVNTPTIQTINSNILFKYDPSEKNIWIDSLQENTKGVFLILHGLNLKPSKMNTLAHYWSAEGYDVLRGTLSGHFGSKDEMLAVTQLTWRRDVTNLVCLALQKAENKNVPLYFLGYSLGAATFLDTIKSQKTSNPFSKAILLAPAIRVKWYANLTKVVSFFSKKIMIPSENLEDYRSQDGTSSAAYEALHSVIDNIESPFSHLDIPTWIFLDPKDELISESGLADLTKEKELSLWSLHRISKTESSLSKNYYHLIIDPPTLGDKAFKDLASSMKSFIENPALKQTK